MREIISDIQFDEVLSRAIPDKRHRDKEKTFSQQVDDVLAGKFSRYDDLKVCDTPQILIDLGCQQLPMLYTQSHLRKAMLPKDRKKHQHGLSVETIKNLPKELANPAMIIDSSSRNDSLILVLSEVDKENNPIIATVKPNGVGKHKNVQKSNFITSIYGREDFPEFLERAIKTNNILYCDKQKSQDLFSVLRLEFSKGLNELDCNVIIHQSSNIVNPKSAKNQEKVIKNQLKEPYREKEREAQNPQKRQTQRASLKQVLNRAKSVSQEQEQKKKENQIHKNKSKNNGNLSM